MTDFFPSKNLTMDEFLLLPDTLRNTFLSNKAEVFQAARSGRLTTQDVYAWLQNYAKTRYTVNLYVYRYNAEDPNQGEENRDGEIGGGVYFESAADLGSFCTEMTKMFA